MAATTAQINAVIATVIAQVPAHAAVSNAVIVDAVSTMLNRLDTEVVVAANQVAQVAEKNAVVTKGKH